MAKAARRTLERARALTAAGDPSGAEAELKRVLGVEPRNAAAWTLYAQLLEGRAEPVRAEDAYGRALDADPKAFVARLNRAVLREQRGAADAALADYEQALAEHPQDPRALRSLGGILRRVGQMERALALLTRARERAPDDAAIRANLGLTLSALGRHDEALTQLDAAVALAPGDERMHHARLLTMHYASGVTPEAVAAAHRAYGAMLESRVPAMTPAPSRASAGQPLRIGFVSADFRRHSVAFFLEPLLAHLSPDDFTVYAYGSVREPDAVTVRLREHIAVYRDVTGLGDDACAELVRRDAIDVLVDLGGHTTNNRLGVFARKPAPVQITYLGYPDTTGLTRMDYRLSDEASDPSGLTERFHTERLLRLPGGFLCYAPPRPSPDPSGAPSARAGHVTFGSFNALAKLSDGVLALWARVLAEVPGSRLLLKEAALSTEAGRALVATRLAKHGIPPERAELLGHTADLASHLAAYGRVDVALDTYPYHGTTTSCDALWMGVPVITLAGRAHVSRVGVSLLERVGLSELVAHDEDGYVQLAAELAADAPRRQRLREGLRARMEASPLRDGARLARELTAAVRAAYDTYARSVGGSDPVAPPPALPDLPEHGMALPDPEARWFGLPSGLVVAGPASNDVFEGYVLAEQGDWYEPEARFVRSLLRAGEQALDLGSGAGVYALTIAERVGPSGRVRACSDLPVELLRLRASARANRLDTIDVVASLADVPDAPWAFVRVSPSEVPGFDVAAVAALCTRADAVVMVERASRPELSEALLDALREAGRELYRYVPGLDALYPHPPDTETDPLLSNLFALSPARARALAERGLCAQFVATAALPRDLALGELNTTIAALGDVDLARAFHGATGTKEAHRAALLQFTASRRGQLPIDARAHALRSAHALALGAIDDPTDVARLSTLARLAADWGQRALAVEACDTALAIHASGRGRLAEPFLPACARYDAIAPGARLAELAVSALLEQRERAGAHSSFFTRDDPACLRRLELLHTLGFQDPEMARRLALVRRHARRA